MDPRAMSFYKNRFGRTDTQSPWLTLEYWAMTREPEFADFDLE
jgi:hypothetical protein